MLHGRGQSPAILHGTIQSPENHRDVGMAKHQILDDGCHGYDRRNAIYALALKLAGAKQKMNV